MKVSSEQDAEIRASMNRVGGNLTLISVGVFGSAILQYAIFFLVARHLGPESYGVFSLALTVAVLAAPFVDLGAAVSLVRTCAHDPTRLPEVLGASLLLRVLLLVPVAVAAVLVCGLVGYGDRVLALLLPLLLASLLDGLGTLGSAVFQAQERMSYTAWTMLFRSLLRCIALALFVILDTTTNTLAWSYVVASAIAAVPVWVNILRTTPIRFRVRELRPTLQKALPLGTITIATILHRQLDVTMLGACSDATEVGAYHAATRFILLAQLVPQAIGTTMNPLDYKLGGMGHGGLVDILRTKVTVLAAIALFGALVLTTQAGSLIELLLGSRYAHSVPVLIALAPMLFVQYMMNPVGDALTAIGKAGVQGRACCIALVANVIGNLLLIPSYGALGAVISSAASEVLYLILMVSALPSFGIDTGFRHTLRRPLAAAGAAALVAALGAGGGATLLAGVIAYVGLALLAPTVEDRRLTGGMVATLQRVRQRRSRAA